MAAKPKSSSGRAIFSAYGRMPTDDDPRFMTVEEAHKALDEMTASADVPPKPRTLDDIHDQVWAKHRRGPTQASADESDDRQEPAPKSLDDIRDAAWAKFNGRAQ